MSQWWALEGGFPYSRRDVYFIDLLQPRLCDQHPSEVVVDKNAEPLSPVSSRVRNASSKKAERQADRLEREVRLQARTEPRALPGCSSSRLKQSPGRIHVL